MKYLSLILLMAVSFFVFGQSAPASSTIADSEYGILGFKLDTKYDDIARSFKLDSINVSDKYYFYKVDSADYTTIDKINFRVELLFATASKTLSAIKVSHKGSESDSYALLIMTKRKFGEPSESFRSSKNLISYKWIGQKTYLDLMRSNSKSKTDESIVEYFEWLTFSKPLGSSRF